VADEVGDILHVKVTCVLLGKSSSFELGESFRIGEKSLAQSLAVLNRFHELAERIRDEQAGVKRGT